MFTWFVHPSVNPLRIGSSWTTCMWFCIFSSLLPVSFQSNSETHSFLLVLCFLTVFSDSQFLTQYSPSAPFLYSPLTTHQHHHPMSAWSSSLLMDYLLCCLQSARRSCTLLRMLYVLWLQAIPAGDPSSPVCICCWCPPLTTIGLN
jgi:hypothetical protein